MMTRISLALRRLLVQLTADRRRFGIFCGLLAVAMLFWTRLIVIQDMPRVAMADPDQSVEVESENMNTSRFVTTKRVVHLSNGPIRNPFLINPAYYPPKSEFAKSTDEDSKSRPQEADKFQSALHAHRLEAVMGSVAVISGQTYRVGTQVRDISGGGLQIELIEVRDRSAVIRAGDVQCVLRLD
ncbi:MAG: hypothetical protein CMJ39_02550 [Phycisphaerae bacterium]|nr:hypothetical protein [Phycisphaerae bacterium]|tara:strand:+ start:277 stop:828 length:552 start_codon:yes stop_codon:yes gene_type:complete